MKNRYFLQETKQKCTGFVFEEVIRYSGTGSYTPELMAGYELLSSKEISEEEAISICGKEAVFGK